MKLFIDDSVESDEISRWVSTFAPHVDILGSEDPVAVVSIASIGGVPDFPCLVHMDRVLAVGDQADIMKAAREYESKQ